MIEYIQSASNGDDCAWSVLYGQYYPLLLPVALRLCGNTPEARDAIQDAFITAYLRLDQLKEPAAFGYWLKKITIHNCCRILRLRRKDAFMKGTLVENTGMLKMEETEPDTLSRIQGLSASLSQLPEKLCATLLLRYYSGFNSYEQIAAILSIPVGTVRSRLYEAKQKLVDEWQPSRAPDNETAESEEWNQFYFEVFSGMHWHDAPKNQFLDHLNSSINVISNGGRIETGRNIVDKLVCDDRHAGSWFKPVNVAGHGNVSIVEVNHFNSKEHPHRCPENSVCVLIRENRKVKRLHLYLSS